MTKLEMFRLALKGYKPGEIAELQELEKLADSEEIEGPADDPIEEPEADEELPADVDNENNDTVEKPQNTVDYKAQYEEAMKKLTELQQLNIQQNLAGKEKNEEEAMASLVHKFIK